MKKRFLFLIIFSVLFFLFFPVKQANAQVSCFQIKVDGDPSNPQLPSPGQAISVIVTAKNNCPSSVGAGYKIEVVWQLRNPDGTSILTQYFTPKIDSYTLVGDVPPGLSAIHTFTTNIGSGETCSTFGSKVAVVAFLSAPTEKSSDFIYTVSNDLGGIGAKLYGNVTDNTGNLTSANVIISPADYSAGSYSASGGFYEFNGLDCSHNHIVTATSTINGQTTTKTVYAAYAGSPSLCNGQGVRVDLSLTKPDCNATPSCSGTCTTTQSNTCSNNGTWSGGCVFTTYNSSTNCTQTTAPNSCSVDNCDSGYKCDSFGTCVSTSCPSMTCRYLEPAPSAANCSSGQQWVKGTGCTGDNCVGCNYVNATCSTTQCYVPGATPSPTPTPTASPTTPPAWGACGSCNTCMGDDKSQCVRDPFGVCQWDPSHCPKSQGNAYCDETDEGMKDPGFIDPFPLGRVRTGLFTNSNPIGSYTCSDLIGYPVTSECWSCSIYYKDHPPYPGFQWHSCFPACHNDIECEIALNNALHHCGDLWGMPYGQCNALPNFNTCGRAMIRGVITDDTSAPNCGGAYFTHLATNGDQQGQLETALAQGLHVYDANTGAWLANCSVYTGDNETRYGCYLDSTTIPANGLKVQIRLGSVTDVNNQVWVATCPASGINSPTVYPNSYGDGPGSYLFGDIAILNQNFGLKIKPITAWIQVNGGDVHSNDRINVSGGP